MIEEDLREHPLDFTLYHRRLKSLKKQIMEAPDENNLPVRYKRIMRARANGSKKVMNRKRTRQELEDDLQREIEARTLLNP